MKYLISATLLALCACNETATKPAQTQIALPVPAASGVTTVRRGNVTTIIGSLN